MKFQSVAFGGSSVRFGRSGWFGGLGVPSQFAGLTASPGSGCALAELHQVFVGGVADDTEEVGEGEIGLFGDEDPIAVAELGLSGISPNLDDELGTVAIGEIIAKLHEVISFARLDGMGGSTSPSNNGEIATADAGLG